jgi:hypothetical protein
MLPVKRVFGEGTIENFVRNIYGGSQMGYWLGYEPTDYLNQCSGYHRPTRTRLAITRDKGIHYGGFHRYAPADLNPQCLQERCIHLRLSWQTESGKPLARNAALTIQIMRFVFGEARKFVLVQGARDLMEEKAELYHYRLFTKKVMEEEWLYPEESVLLEQFRPPDMIPWPEIEQQLMQRIPLSLTGR